VWWAALFFVGVCASSAVGQVVLVPAYFYPSGNVCGGTLGYWDCLVTAAATYPAVGAGGLIIANPGNGPGSSYDPLYGQAINATLAAGDAFRSRLASMLTSDSSVATRIAKLTSTPPMRVIGYVRTGYGGRATSAIVADVSRWLTLYNVSGFFLDEAITTAAGFTQFQTIVTSIRQLLISGPLVCNFGTVPDIENYTALCDVLVTHEDYASQFGSAPSISWMLRYSTSRFAVLYHTLSNATQMRTMAAACVNGIGTLGAAYAPGYVYFTDRPLTPNPWDVLPSFWWSHLAVIAKPTSLFGPSVPRFASPFVSTVATASDPRYLNTSLLIAATFAANSAAGNVFHGDNVAAAFNTLNPETVPPQAQTSAASFFTLLCKLTYGLSDVNLQSWLGTPTGAGFTAAQIASSIIRSNGSLVRIGSVVDILPGDILTVVYASAGAARDNSTGHVMIVVNATRRPVDTAPIVAGTAQYDVWVVDSVGTPHGSADLRTAGIGAARVRLYANTTSTYSYATGLSSFALQAADTASATKFELGFAGMSWSGDSSEVYLSFADSTVRYAVVGRPTMLSVFETDTAFTSTSTPVPPGNTSMTASPSSSATATMMPSGVPPPTSTPLTVLATRLLTFVYVIQGTAFVGLLASPSLPTAIAEDVAADLGVDVTQVLVTGISASNSNLTTSVDIRATNASNITTQVKALQNAYTFSLHDFPSVRALYLAANPTSTESVSTLSITLGNINPAATPASAFGGSPKSTSTCGTACGVFYGIVVIALVATVAVGVGIVVLKPSVPSVIQPPSAAVAPPTTTQ
jgi:hypothetical protein